MGRVALGCGYVETKLQLLDQEGNFGEYIMVGRYGDV